MRSISVKFIVAQFYVIYYIGILLNSSNFQYYQVSFISKESNLLHFLAPQTLNFVIQMFEQDIPK
jgi:hypothetical protein